MIVQVVSLGSLWLTRPGDSRVVWNTTGVLVNGALRPRARTYGVVRFATQDAQAVCADSVHRQVRWVSSPVGAHDGANTLHLIRRAGRRSYPDAFLVSVGNDLVGPVQGWDERAQTIAWSVCGSAQEILLLMHAFGYVRGAHGCAVLTVDQKCARWDVTRW